MKQQRPPGPQVFWESDARVADASVCQKLFVLLTCLLGRGVTVVSSCCVVLYCTMAGDVPLRRSCSLLLRLQLAMEPF